MKKYLITHTDLDGVSPIILLGLTNESFDYKCVDLLDDISILKGFGVSNFRVDLLDEKDSDIEYILRRLDVI